MSIQRQTALITGASSGIGYELAHIFAKRGYDLLLVSRNVSKLEALSAELEKNNGVSVTILPADLSRPGSAALVFEETARRNLDVDVLVNNAGVGLAGEHVEQDIRRVTDLIQINTTTPTELCLLFGAQMKKKKSGYILNVASTAAYQPVPYTAVYGGSKSFLLNFSEALAMELKDYNVGVTCLSPGPTDTDFFAALGVEGLTQKERGFWAKKNRMPSHEVAEIGVSALFSKKISQIAGGLNALIAFMNRLAPRKVSANVSKILMRKAAGL